MNLIRFTIYEPDDTECYYDPTLEVLYDADTHKIIASGDWYHDKISDYIKGFLEGLSYARKTFELNKRSVNCDYFDFDPEDHLS